MAKEQLGLSKITREDLRSTSLVGRIHDKLPIDFLGILPYDMRQEGKTLASFAREYLEKYPEGKSKKLEIEILKFVEKMKEWYGITSDPPAKGQ